ncbi:MAG: hypothetical protein ACK5MN_13635 [Lachnospiraceae bacterium]
MLYFLFVRIPITIAGVIGAILAGCLGGIYSIPIPITANILYTDRDTYTKVVSYCTAAATLCNTFSNIIFHGFYDVSGNYIISLMYTLVLSVTCFVLIIGMIRRNRSLFIGGKTYGKRG